MYRFTSISYLAPKAQTAKQYLQNLSSFVSPPLPPPLTFSLSACCFHRCSRSPARERSLRSSMAERRSQALPRSCPYMPTRRGRRSIGGRAAAAARTGWGWRCSMTAFALAAHTTEGARRGALHVPPRPQPLHRPHPWRSSLVVPLGFHNATSLRPVSTCYLPHRRLALARRHHRGQICEIRSSPTPFSVSSALDLSCLI